MTQTADTLDNNYFLARLRQMRKFGGAADTVGLPDGIIEKFLAADPALAAAIERAHADFERLKTTHADLLDVDEAGQRARIQQD